MYEFDYFSWGLGLLTMLITVFVVRFIHSKMIRKKKHTFETIRVELDEGYKGLMRAANSFHEFNDVLNGVSKNAKG